MRQTDEEAMRIVGFRGRVEATKVKLLELTHQSPIPYIGMLRLLSLGVHHPAYSSPLTLGPWNSTSNDVLNDDDDLTLYCLGNDLEHDPPGIRDTRYDS